MFERYTEKARRVIFFARYEASQFGSPYIETEHLLLGLLREDKALTNHFLRLHASVESIRTQIEEHSTIREKVSTSVDLPVSNESKRVLAYAAEEAERLKHKHIGTGHLLLGLLREEKCFAARLLNGHNVSLEQAREKVREVEAQEPQRAGERAPSSLPFSGLDFGFVHQVDLTRQAMEGLLPPLIGRERELQRMIQILCRLTRPNPLLVGEPGVGKKTIVNGLVQRISDGLVPALAERRVLSIDLASISLRGLSRKWLDDQLHGIVFIANLAKLAWIPEPISLASVVKPALQAGVIQCISAATPAEYSKAVEAEPWLKHQFNVIEVKPATEDETIAVLAGIQQRFEKFHDVVYEDEAIQSAVFHANSYFPDRYLPEKAVDLMDEAGALVKLREGQLPDEIREVQKRFRFIQHHHDSAIMNHEFEKARFYADEVKKEKENLEALRKKHNLSEKTVTVTRDDIEQIVAEKTGLSVDLLRKSKAEKPKDEKK